MVIEVKNLSKRFGKILAVDNISFQVKEGEIFGLIGPNGAGKSTTLRMIATIFEPTNGEIEIFGKTIRQGEGSKDSGEVRKLMSYLPEEAGVYKNLTGREYLSFIASFYSSEKNKIVEEGVKIAKLGNRIDDKTSTYSKGMVRKLLVAKTLMVCPKLAILDEPTAGLDVINAREVRVMIKNYAKQQGVTVILSSHNMLEVEYICDRIALINKGKIVEEGTPQELKSKYNVDNIEEVFAICVS